VAEAAEININENIKIASQPITASWRRHGCASLKVTILKSGVALIWRWRLAIAKWR